MYVGSAEFQTANSRFIQMHRISGTIDGHAFGPENVLLNSVRINNQCSDQIDAQIGAVYIGTLEITFLPNLNILPTTWQGREIVINFSLLTDQDPETWETFTLGVFHVAECNRTMQGYEITAYDNMAAFDKAITWDYLPAGKLYNILTDICTRCGVTLGMTLAQCEALPNGNTNLGLFPGSDCQTYRDIIFWLSQTVAGFATMDRSGRLVLRSYTNIMEDPADVPELPADKRLTGASISDYVTRFRGVTLYNMKQETNVYYGAAGIDPVYTLGANPFLQYGTAGAISNMVAQIVHGISYHLRPFSASIMSAPVWELGDRIRLTGGIAQGYDTVTVIHAISYTSGQSMELHCYGANPAIQESGTQDKESTTASNSARLNNTSYKRYANPNTITVGSTPTKIVDITFTAEKETDFDVWHEFLLTSQLATGSDAVELEAIYYLDSVELARKPVETYEDEARHIMTLNYSEAVNDGNHQWEVYLVASGGTATINTSDAIAVLKGQGLSNADTWDGIILLNDDVAIQHMQINSTAVAETLTVHIIEPEDIIAESFAEDVAPETMEINTPTITEAVNIIFIQPTNPIEDETSTDVLATETDAYYIGTE